MGSCMRSTPGTTSVTSVDAGSCSCRGLRARGWVSVTLARVHGAVSEAQRSELAGAASDREAGIPPRSERDLGICHGGELRPGAVLLGHCATPEDELLVVTACHGLEAPRP